MRAYPGRLGLVVGAALTLGGCSSVLLDSQGTVGLAQRQLMLNSVTVMLAIVIPVIIASLVIAWWFRASNARAVYWPEWSFSGRLEFIIWSVPAMLILFLGTLAWYGSHALDPARPLESGEHGAKPITIQVVSLDWKWLFIYPEQGIASINEIAIPVATPIAFRLTSSGVMNSFFIPQLGSQIYTMAGMETKLHLDALKAGTYDGISAQYSGGGFSKMQFRVLAMPEVEYEQWIARTKASTAALDANAYAALLKPAVSDVMYFGSVSPSLFADIAARRIATPEGLARGPHKSGGH